MRVARTVAEVRDAVRAARAEGRTVGVVPTMGWFHEGHLSLMRRARETTGFVIVTLFVNPTQFNDPADLVAYPRDEQRDARMAEAEGVDLLFAPSPEEVYPAGFASEVRVSGVTEPLEGESRGPAHFRGVATVVLKLLNIAQADVAFFGQKDAQQALVIRRMTRDLDVPTRIEVCPTVREPDGLAMSSRNVRLSTDDRGRALALKRGLDAAAVLVRAGERDATRVERAGADAMRTLGVEPEYLAVVSADTLAPFAGTPLEGEVLIAVAARVGPVRLIDNVLLEAER